MALLIAFAIYQTNKKEQKIEQRLAPFNAVSIQYLAKDKTAKNRLPVTGKIIVIDAESGSLIPFEEYERQLNPKHIPTHPDEVDTVILQDCKWDKVGFYSAGGDGLQESCQFYVIKPKERIWSSWGETKGSMPPDEVRRRRSSTSDVKGGRAIIEFLHGNLK
ncbi:hypothetical protein [Aromatoleum bremense]|uniref:Uncharacterized protein n=1 Tax=Aromatoleum bremense TaxID=76115 RepID=A0ABX1P000_9RHOO|nr:hypothetical protein [Aromatoleum bremense]NMG17638.1 hypothetical protein [Aromatoleum bremense]